MNQFLTWLQQAFSSWKFWVVVPPWDVGVRVRLGKIAATLKPGPHFRIPFLDEITLVNTRLRIIGIQPITISSSRGYARTVRGFVAYRVTDPVAAMLAFSFADPVVAARAQGVLAHTSNPDAALKAVSERFEKTGVLIESVSITEDVEVRTYRLLTGSGETMWGAGGSQPPPSAFVDGISRI